MNGLKYFLQDVAILMAIYLLTRWMGVDYGLWAWIIVVVGFVAFGVLNYARGHRDGVRSPKGVVHFKTKAEADAFIAEHTKKNVEINRRESN